MAMAHGVIIGVVAIIVVGMIFVGAEGKRPVNEIEKEIPTTGPQQEQRNQEEKNEQLTLYAKQHGAFTNSASAATFIAEDSSLSTAAIIQVDAQFFVWSAVEKTEAGIEAKLDDKSFKKEFTIARNSCHPQLAESLWEIFKEDDMAKIKISNAENDDEKMEEFNKKMETITAFTKDLSVIRLHVLANYVNEEDCVKITF